MAGSTLLRFFRRGDREDKNKTEQAVERTRRTWFRRVTRVFQRSQIDDEMWDELEELLISADVGVTTSMKLLDGLRDRIRSQAISRPDEALQELKAEMADLLSPKDGARAMETDEPPLVLLMAGVNGAGKTTSIAKLANLYKNEGKSVLLGAGDTFRAAAVEQLQTWGERLEIDVVAHRQGADPGAVAFDSVQAAVSRNADVVIIDTAGRLHTRSNLMDELKKIRNVIARQGVARSLKVVLTMDATTGQNGLIQARAFTEAIDCDGVFLSKLDGTAKGGVVLAIADDLDLPVLFIGTGEQPEDIAVFDAENFVDGLFSTADAAND
ncbi:MAG: signal recognition particle-docking protein FtsY [SAR202 cluster bacterium]|jgi:fused signal recognition particle receptor|nr:signal recognition particle-docking protein FtsY [SAR202 cluster bacterium]MDP7414324.1 signal recognition particle-docking protein FtsY [SAR202 cluster bacterium]|tara:strand:+ start:899 stop:1873 length:975 start_codon:yes stop_codon:yes gene_type:complete